MEALERGQAYVGPSEKRVRIRRVLVRGIVRVQLRPGGRIQEWGADVFRREFRPAVKQEVNAWVKPKA